MKMDDKKSDAENQMLKISFSMFFLEKRWNGIWCRSPWEDDDRGEMVILLMLMPLTQEPQFQIVPVVDTER